MNLLRWTLAGLVILSSAGLSRAQSGSVWSLGPDGRSQSQLGTWERLGQRARYQSLSSPLGLEINLQQPTADSTQDVPVFLIHESIQPPRTSNYFTPGRPRVAPQQSMFQGTGVGIIQPRIHGEVALDSRTFTGQSFDGWWRPVTAPSVSRYTRPVILNGGPWQPVRFIIESRGQASARR